MTMTNSEKLFHETHVQMLYLLDQIDQEQSDTGEDIAALANYRPRTRTRPEARVVPIELQTRMTT